MVKMILSFMIYKLGTVKIIRITLVIRCHVGRIGDPATCIRESEKLSCSIDCVSSQSKVNSRAGAPWKTTCATVANCPAVIGSVYGV